MDLFDHPVVHATKHVAKHVVQQCPAIPPCPTCPTVMSHFNFLYGVSELMYALIGSAVALAIGFGLGWYVKGRGLTGVETDLGNAKTTVTAAVAAV